MRFNAGLVCGAEFKAICFVAGAENDDKEHFHENHSDDMRFDFVNGIDAGRSLFVLRVRR